MADDGVFSPNGPPAVLSWLPKVGLWAASFVACVVASIIVVAALAAVHEIVLPMTFAAVLAVIFKPIAGVLTRHRIKPSIAAGLVVLGLLGLVTVVMVATVQGVVDQMASIGESVDAAAAEAALALGIDQASLDAVRAAAVEATPTLEGGS